MKCFCFKQCYIGTNYIQIGIKKKHGLIWQAVVRKVAKVIGACLKKMHGQGTCNGVHCHRCVPFVQSKRQIVSIVLEVMFAHAVPIIFLNLVLVLNSCKY